MEQNSPGSPKDFSEMKKDIASETEKNELVRGAAVLDAKKLNQIFQSSFVRMFKARKLICNNLIEKYKKNNIGVVDAITAAFESGYVEGLAAIPEENFIPECYLEGKVETKEA